MLDGGATPIGHDSLHQVKPTQEELGPSVQRASSTRTQIRKPEGAGAVAKRRRASWAPPRTRPGATRWSPMASPKSSRPSPLTQHAEEPRIHHVLAGPIL
eukprot:11170102-Lingulodinium_polyedra.AAC.2